MLSLVPDQFQTLGFRAEPGLLDQFYTLEFHAEPGFRSRSDPRVPCSAWSQITSTP